MQTEETQISSETAKNLGLSQEEFNRVLEFMGRPPNFVELSIFSEIWSKSKANGKTKNWFKVLPVNGKAILNSVSEKNIALIDIGEGLSCVFKMISRANALNSRVAHSVNELHWDIFTPGVRPLAMLQYSSFDNIDVTLSLGLIKSDETIVAHTTDSVKFIFIAGAFKESTNREEQFIEACLEVVKMGEMHEVQSLQNSGIILAISKIIEKNGSGAKIDLANLSTDDSPLSCLNVLLTKSQKAVLILGTKEQKKILKGIFTKHNIECQEIGLITDTGRLKVCHGEEIIADVPYQSLIQEVGSTDNIRVCKRPEYLKKASHFRLSKLPKPKSFVEAAKKVFSSDHMVSKILMYECNGLSTYSQYEETEAKSDASLLEIKESEKSLAISINCNSFYVYANPYKGAMIAVAESAGKVIYSGGHPVAAISCLHFGDSHDPEAYWQFTQAIKGIGDACRKLTTPIAGYRTNFQNQSNSDKAALLESPRPIIGMLGIIENNKTVTPSGFQEIGHKIYMIGTPHNDVGSSEYLRSVHQIYISPAPRFDLDEEFHIQQSLKKLIQNGKIKSAHKISEGGLFVALIESALFNEFGFEVELDTNFRKDAYLFGESQSRIIISVTADIEDELVNNLNSRNVPFTRLGEVIKDQILIDDENFGSIQYWKLLIKDHPGKK